MAIFSNVGLRFSGLRSDADRRKSQGGVPVASIRLKIRDQQPADVMDILEKRRQQGVTSARQVRSAEKWLARLNEALHTWDAGQFNKAKKQLLTLCQPASALMIEVSEPVLPDLHRLDTGKMDFTGVKLYSGNGLPIRPVARHLQAAHLSAPLIDKLASPTLQQQAEGLVLMMAGCLEDSNSAGFNQAKRGLSALLTANGLPVGRENPLVLRLNTPELLSNKRLVGLDLSNVSLNPSKDGKLRLENTVLQHCDLRNTAIRQAEFKNSVLLGNQMAGAALDGARFEASLLLLNGMPQASVAQSVWKDSDLLLNAMPGLSLSDAYLYESDLSLNQLSDANLSEMVMDRSTARFNLLPMAYYLLNNNVEIADPAGVTAILRDTVERMQSIWLRLEKQMGVPHSVAGDTPDLLRRYLYRTAKSADMVLPPSLLQRKVIRGLTNLLVSTEELPDYIQKRHPYAELAGILPAWTALLNRLPDFQRAQTPLAEPEFLSAFTTRLRTQRGNKREAGAGGAFRRLLKRFLD